MPIQLSFGMTSHEEEEEIVFNQDMFDILDNVIKSCRENAMYVILDMHAAYTSQSGIGCDDGVDNSVHLFVEEESMERTILLWERLAHIYIRMNHVLRVMNYLMNLWHYLSGTI